MNDGRYAHLFEHAKRAGFAESDAQAIVGAVREMDAAEKYETEHVDAAAAYSVLVTERYGIPDYAVECFFRTCGITYDSVHDVECRESSPDYTVVHVAYLGQSEIEHQSEYELTDEAVAFVERYTSWTVAACVPQLWYTMYPDNLHVFAYVDSEYADKLKE